MPVRRVLRRALAVTAGVVIVLALAAVLTTGVDRQPLAFIAGPRAVDVPDWSRPCWRRGRYTLACARVHGRVILRQLRDPDGDGDHHLVVIAGARLVTLKIPLTTHASIPGYGARVTAVGRVERGVGQLGTDVVDVATLTSP